MSKTFDIKSLKGITQDSRQVKSGYLFAALSGAKADGQDYIAEAIYNGATAILAPKGAVLPDLESVVDIALITDENPRKALALIAAEFYSKQSSNIVAVTGTNGKTSTVFFTQQLWKSQNIKASSLGTLGVGGRSAASMTTPDPVSLHATLADLSAAGVTHLAIEASSHGLDQYRLDGVKIKAAGFTNLSHDHLDYHGNMEEYAAAKLRLFSELLQPGGTAVLNADSDGYETIKKSTEASGHKVYGYGFKGEELKLNKITPTPHGQKIDLSIFEQDYTLTVPLVGAFQIMNLLCALGLVLAGDPDNQAGYIEALSNMTGVPGRLQLVNADLNGAAVYVDYAHTPDALKQVLTALRPHTQGRLVCVFGCGGERDHDKRAMMGDVAKQYADTIIVTDDNPRNEDPAEIRAAILARIGDAKEIADRREAIQSAVENLQEGDVLLIAGKGHEQGQIFADYTDPFDDVEEAQRAIEELKTNA